MSIKLAILTNSHCIQTNADTASLHPECRAGIERIVEQAANTNIDVIGVGADKPINWLSMDTTFIPSIGNSAESLSGLLAALYAVSSTDAVITISSDMTKVDTRALNWLVNEWHESYDCLLLRDSNGRAIPQFSIYTPALIPNIEKNILAGHYSPESVCFDASTVEILAPAWLEPKLARAHKSHTEEQSRLQEESTLYPIPATLTNIQVS